MAEPIFSPVRLAVAVGCCALVALPFLVVRYPPITDLPQHVAQIRLFTETVWQDAGAYRIQWLTPYGVVYLLLGGAWLMVPAEDAGRVAVLLLALVSTLAVHFLAASRKRSVVAAVLASAFFFNHSVYWGFLSFAMGWVAFVLWFVVTTSRPTSSFSTRDAALLLGGAVLLYFSHALWFVVGIVWLAVHGLRARLPMRAWALRFASVTPVGLMAALWYPRLESGGFTSPTVWFIDPLDRLSPNWFADAILGGRYGAAEPLLLLFAGGWVAFCFTRSVRPLREAVDADLLVFALLLAAMGLLLPDQHMNTIQFAERWMPPAAIALLLAAPAPSFRPAAARWVAVAALAVFCMSTAAAWRRFERDEMSGLRDAVASLPPAQRVIGLDFVKDSRIIKGRPFLQSFAYAQVVRGASLNFSFAGFAPSPVVYRDRFRRPWTASLEWFAERLKRSDLQYFDYAILNGGERVHRTFSAQPELQPQTHAGRWRLYRVNPEVAANYSSLPAEGRP